MATELGKWGSELLRSSLVRSRLERDLHVGDLRVLSDVAFGRTARPHFNPVERLCKRGFLVETNCGPCCRMTLKGWIAIFLRYTCARNAPSLKKSSRLLKTASISHRGEWSENDYDVFDGDR